MIGDPPRPRARSSPTATTEGVAGKKGSTCVDQPGEQAEVSTGAGPDDRRAADRQDFTSDQEVRWCPGCGDYAILTAVQGFLPDLGSAGRTSCSSAGIGCSSRFPYYLNTYGMHSIHGRAPADRHRPGHWPARTCRSGSSTGDGDAPVDRRQPPDPRAAPQRQHDDPAVQQPDLRPDQGASTRPPARSARSPSRRRWARWTTRSTPSLALGAEGVRRLHHRLDRKHLTSVLSAAAAHRGTSFVEIYQNCPIFNDGAFDAIRTTTPGRRDHPAGPRRADHLRQRLQGPGPRHRHRRVKTSRSGPDTARSTRRAAGPRRPQPRPDHRVRHLPAHRLRLPQPVADRGSSGRSSGRRTTTWPRPGRDRQEAAAGDDAERLAALIGGGDT